MTYKMPYAVYLRDEAGVYYAEGCDPKTASSRERWDNMLGGPLSIGAIILRKRMSSVELSAECWKSMALLGAQQRTFMGQNNTVMTNLVFVEGPPTFEEHVLETFNRFDRLPHAFPNPTEGICNGE